MSNQQDRPTSLSGNKLPRILRYAAVDIGSNAVRLLLCNAVEEHDEIHYKKSELIRIPLRLGMDVFQGGKISAKRAQDFAKTMKAFKLLIDVYNPVAYRACATAAFREASNGEELLRMIRKECGMKVEIIDGKTEAELIYSNHVEEHLDKNKSYLYIDVGGGSTEITLFDRGQCLDSQSFEIGTLRWLNGQVKKEDWDGFKMWVRSISENHHPLTAIGTGGNINKIFRMVGRKDKPLPFLKLKELYDEMKVHTVEDRMEIWGFSPDRADVIVPAAKIFLSIMKAAQIEEIIVPQIGLADGIVHQLNEQYRASVLA